MNAYFLNGPLAGQLKKNLLDTKILNVPVLDQPPSLGAVCEGDPLTPFNVETRTVRYKHVGSWIDHEYFQTDESPTAVLS